MSTAIAREQALKEWKRAWKKTELIEKMNLQWKDWYEGQV